ncbi:MAG: NUDIX hydrolase [Gammaproteobacteria bacterium]|nr:NUDIX hydrolase [Gammaproteobacteria bacterium]NNC96722.1 NUDIX hydrolase [Gammaproteobacteria bacterium]NNM14303.1 NUDIX hydrolase [Gammaproteobacteria bacterium]
MKYCPICTTELESKLLTSEDRERLICISESCTYIHYDNPTPVVAAIVDYQDQILLAHNTLWPPSWYGLVTGFLEKGESPEQGIIRELKEETDLEAKEVSLVGLYTFERMNQLIIAYHVVASGEIKLNEELDDYKLFAKDKVRYWPSGTGFALRDYIKSVLPGHEPGLMEFARPASHEN